MNPTRHTALLAGAAALMVPATAFAKAKPVYTEGRIAMCFAGSHHEGWVAAQRIQVIGLFTAAGNCRAPGAKAI